VPYVYLTVSAGVLLWVCTRRGVDPEHQHKTLKNTPVKVGQSEANLLTYLLSGTQINRVYWHDNGKNYAVSADGHVSVKEPLPRPGNPPQGSRPRNGHHGHREGLLKAPVVVVWPGLPIGIGTSKLMPRSYTSRAGRS
jgi:hypothetical protein